MVAHSSYLPMGSQGLDEAHGHLKSLGNSEAKVGSSRGPPSARIGNGSASVSSPDRVFSHNRNTYTPKG